MVKQLSELLKIGTCSWKYPFWKGILYSEGIGSNYLSEYARYYNTVEIDQWFWSLFTGNKVVLPKPEVVTDYMASVPSHFQFSIKVPNSITLTHYYRKDKNGSLKKNPFFLSNDIFSEFLKLLQSMKNHLGAFIFQFEYLNKQKMPNQITFQEQFSTFIKKCPKVFNYCLEIRNSNYLNEGYLHFLQSCHLSHVFYRVTTCLPFLTCIKKLIIWLRRIFSNKVNGNRQERDLKAIINSIGNARENSIVISIK